MKVPLTYIFHNSRFNTTGQPTLRLQLFSLGRVVLQHPLVVYKYKRKIGALYLKKKKKKIT